MPWSQGEAFPPVSGIEWSPGSVQPFLVNFQPVDKLPLGLILYMDVPRAR